MRRAGKNVGKLKFLNGFNGKFMGKSIINGGSVCKSIEVNDGFLIDHLYEVNHRTIWAFSMAMLLYRVVE
jgi:hypothetical protein